MKREIKHKELGFFREIICKLFHNYYRKASFFYDPISNKTVSHYYCPKCDVVFMATSLRGMRTYTTWSTIGKQNYPIVQAVIPHE